MTPNTKLEQRPVSNLAKARLRARGMSEVLARAYAARGVISPADVRGEYGDLIPPDQMKGVREMANYLADCLVRRTRVLIVADYDCDGATACSILVMAFAGAGMNFGYMVPDRLVHGYGLTPAIIDDAVKLQDKPEVIITVDNGISSIAGVQRAAELGIEVLVTDHHIAPAVLPPARLIVNPNQPGCEFPSKNIAGCGVAWYVARAFLEELAARDLDPGFDPAELLSYVAVGTVADVVQLDKNNRTLVRLGLELIRKSQCAPGVLALARVSGKNPNTLTCSDIGFGIGPRINAAGRLAHMSAGIQCLTTLDRIEANALAVKLNETNDERKSMQKEMEDQAVLQAWMLLRKEASDPSDPLGRRSIVVFHAEWHEGVVGVVAGRLKEAQHRPTIVMTYAQDGTIKGSGRSIPGFHLKHALDEINAQRPGILQKFGGHAMAAGMTIDPNRLDEFRTVFEAVCREHLTAEMMQKTLKHDGVYPSAELDCDTIHAISQEVWGQGFEEPVFVNEIVVNKCEAIGQDKTHLKIKGSLSGVELDVMAFGQADLMRSIPDKLVVAFKPQVNEFRGERSLQALVELLPLDANPSLAPALLARAELLEEAAESLQGTSHDPSPAGTSPEPVAEAVVAADANAEAAPAVVALARDESTEAPQRRLRFKR